MRHFLATFAIPVLFVGSTAFAGVVQPLSGAPEILIPVAGTVPGANGTFFRSDISIANRANHQQTVALKWLPEAGMGEPVTKFVTLPLAINAVRSVDFVADYLGQTGIGSILITGVTSSGAPDPTAMLYVTERIWTPQPGTNGTTSQSFPAIPVSSINSTHTLLFGMGGPDNPANYRVNVGIINLDPNNAQTYFVSYPSGLAGVPFFGISVTVLPMTLKQFPFNNTAVHIGIDNITTAEIRSNLWMAYGSTVNNLTGDAWSELATTISE